MLFGPTGTTGQLPSPRKCVRRLCGRRGPGDEDDAEAVADVRDKRVVTADDDGSGVTDGPTPSLA
jgi:hypothetical protein